MTFHVGQKVVCVDANSGPYEWARGEEIIEGTIYTVAKLDIAPTGGVVVVELIEQRRAPNIMAMWGHMGYGAYRFRPVVEPKAETSFTEGAPFDSLRLDNRVKKRERVG